VSDRIQIFDAENPHCRSCRCFKPKPKRSGGIKRTSADIQWSRAVRLRDDYTCQYPECGRRFPDDIGQVDAAHCFGRTCKVCTGKRQGWRTPHGCTRLELDNGVTLCRPHHMWMDQHTTEKYAFFRERLGDEAFDALEAKAKSRRDRRGSER
jgi:hypothetical protein